jgi:molybdate transport system substrate-binding protein
MMVRPVQPLRITPMSPIKRSSRRLAAFALLAALVLAPDVARAQPGAEVLVAAASDLNFALKEILTEFEHDTGARVKLSLGSSGNLHAQIRNGAPFDLFLSADGALARDLEQAHLAEPRSTFVYAFGQIVLWVPNASGIDLDKPGLEPLLDAAARKIAIANPKHAPYGRAAVAALRHYGVYDTIRAKLVYGESILQAAQFVETGAADLGIIARSLATAPAMLRSGRHRLVPDDAYPRLEQAGVLLRSARGRGHLEAARALVDWLRGSRGRTSLEKYGFILPPAPGPEGRAPR